MIPEPLSYMDQAVLARFTRQELRTAWHCRLLALVCLWRDTQGEGLDPVPHPHWAPVWPSASWFICTNSVRSSWPAQGQRDTEHHPPGSQSFSQQLGSQRGALGNGAAAWESTC